MTRVTQAFKRLREIAQDKDGIAEVLEDTRTNRTRLRDFEPDPEPIVDLPTSMPPSTVAHTKITDPLAPGAATSTSVRCPHCQTRLERRPRGLWTKRFLGLLGIAAYRCRSCGHRFSAFESEAETNQRLGAVFSTFLRPKDNRTFNDLIRDIARAERERDPGFKLWLRERAGQGITDAGERAAGQPRRATSSHLVRSLVGR